MPEPLKNQYNKSYILRIFNALKAKKINVSEDSFLQNVFNNEWKNFELKGRLHHLAKVINSYLSSDFNIKAKQVIAITQELRKTPQSGDGYLGGFMPQIIEATGLENLPTSCKVFEQITSFASCEFAVRPFIDHYPTEMMQQMLTWSYHKNEHVRRLASEGCRPLLPWGSVLRELKANPTPIIPILESLKNDESEYVRRSVANNLNDISKDHPNIVLNLISTWKGESKEVDALLKHAARTLLKQGNPMALKVFGWYYDKKIELNKLEVPKRVNWNSKLNFSFSIQNRDSKLRKVRLEYGLYLKKANGKLNKKVFQISSTTLKPNEKKVLSPSVNFKPISTRKYYPGEHQIGIIVNGLEIKKQSFMLLPKD